MATMSRLLLLSAFFSSVTFAEPHGPSAALNEFPSHRFQLAPRTPTLQIAFHAGLIQPLLLQGFNAAIDVRVNRFIATYSHGEGLDGVGKVSLSPTELGRGADLGLTWSTGGGFGVTLIDELYVLVDFKVHRYAFTAGGERADYTTVTIGGEVGYRFFIWKGFHIAPVVRFWPNVWSSIPQGMTVGGVEHKAGSQGFYGLFANVLVGWAFDVVP